MNIPKIIYHLLLLLLLFTRNLVLVFYIAYNVYLPFLVNVLSLVYE